MQKGNISVGIVSGRGVCGIIVVASVFLNPSALVTQFGNGATKIILSNIIIQFDVWLIVPGLVRLGASGQQRLEGATYCLSNKKQPLAGANMHVAFRARCALYVGYCQTNTRLEPRICM